MVISVFCQHNNYVYELILSSFTHCPLFADDRSFVIIYSMSALCRWPFIIVGLITLPAALAFFYFFLTKPGSRQMSMSLSLEMTLPPPTPTDTSFLLAKHRKR
jgi:hypothetical protein